MLLPRFSIRTLLVLLTLAAIVSVVVGMAVRGQNWAWGFSIGLLSLILTGLVHAAWFGIVWILAQMSTSDPHRHERKSDQA
ncbi:MAG: hypothetical protein IT427_09970 [Pirellulales bacterium]|jgi:fucose permease|nr:hypothetical protein [Pirellulales bacterium]